MAALFCGQLGSGQATSTSAAKKSTATKAVTSSTGTATKSGSKAAPTKTAAGAGKSTAGKAASKAAGKSPEPVSHVAAGKKAPPRRVLPPPRYVQQQPSADRYREIQQALADRGYFHGSTDGAWGSESTDALKRFQADQNLDVDGKIGSLSLIALGLGPRHDGVPAKPGPASGDQGAEPSSGAQPEAMPVTAP